jgi:hypothetical protein
MRGMRLNLRGSWSWSGFSFSMTLIGSWWASVGAITTGLALQLVTVRFLGAFLDDPLDVPTAVVDFVAGQVGVSDPSCVKRYVERKQTRFEHQWAIADGRRLLRRCRAGKHVGKR